MLFGAAREIIRATTGRGPWHAMIIPATYFLKDVPLATPATEINPSHKSKPARMKKLAKIAKSQNS